MATFNTNREMEDKELLKEYKARRKAERRENCKSNFWETAALIAPAAIFTAGVVALNSASTRRAERKKSQEDNLVAIGLGYSGDKDPAWKAFEYRQRNHLLALDVDEEDDDETDIFDDEEEES